MLAGRKWSQIVGKNRRLTKFWSRNFFRPSLSLFFGLFQKRKPTFFLKKFYFTLFLDQNLILRSLVQFLVRLDHSLGTFSGLLCFVNFLFFKKSAKRVGFKCRAHGIKCREFCGRHFGGIFWCLGPRTRTFLSRKHFF